MLQPRLQWGEEKNINYTITEFPFVLHIADLNRLAPVLKPQCLLGLGTVLFMLHLSVQNSFHTLRGFLKTAAAASDKIKRMVPLNTFCGFLWGWKLSEPFEISAHLWLDPSLVPSSLSELYLFQIVSLQPWANPLNPVFVTKHSSSLPHVNPFTRPSRHVPSRPLVCVCALRRDLMCVSSCIYIFQRFKLLIADCFFSVFLYRRSNIAHQYDRQSSLASARDTAITTVAVHNRQHHHFSSNCHPCYPRERRLL